MSKGQHICPECGENYNTKCTNIVCPVGVKNCERECEKLARITKTQQRTYLDWNDIADFTDWLRDIKQRGDFKIDGKDPVGVYGIPRAGLIPAVMISNILGIPMLISPRAGCIVCDDIVDTGTTMKPYSVKHHGRNCLTLAIVQKSTAEYKADLAFRTIKPEDGWVIFPWE